MYFCGDELYQIGNLSHSQMMGYILRSNNGLIVIDGGTYGEADLIEKMLLNFGGYVNGWFLTHAHFDHIQAITEIISRHKINIGCIYYNFPSIEKIFEIEKNEKIRCETVKRFSEVISNYSGKIQKPIENVQIECGGFAIIPLTKPNLIADNLNDTSIVYRVNTRGDSILFTGDLGEKEQNKLIENHPKEIICPIVQMAHHGQNALNKTFYTYIKPKVCLWPTPDWLWDNLTPLGFDTGVYKTVKTRQWISEIGSKNINSFGKVTLLK